MQRVPQVDRWLHDIRACRYVALDTNVVIYALQSVEPYDALVHHLLGFMERGFIVGTVSTVVEAEVLVKPFRELDQPAIEKATLFFRESRHLLVRSFDRAVARRAALVRATTRLPLADAIIIATALEERCDALVGNDSSMAERAIGMPYLHLDDYVS